MVEEKTIVRNRRAQHFYEIVRTYEAGLVLTGPEVKSLRAGRANIEEAYVAPSHNELYLINMHISPYTEAGRFNPPDPYRPRKLLLHAREIKRLIGSIAQKGYTIVPLRLYFNERGYAKVEIALARGKKLHDRREELKRRAQRRDMERELKRKRHL